MHLQVANLSCWLSIRHAQLTDDRQLMAILMFLDIPRHHAIQRKVKRRLVIAQLLQVAQFELNRKSAMFALAFGESLDERLRQDCSPRSRSGQATNWGDLGLVDDRPLCNP